MFRQKKHLFFQIFIFEDSYETKSTVLRFELVYQEGGVHMDLEFVEDPKPQFEVYICT